MRYTGTKQGFTLLEMSIVLIIIALLAGGIIAGQNLIRTAELRGIMSDFRTYQSAVSNFQDKYRALPGDMPNATKYWGIAGGSTGDDSACWTVNSSTLSDTKRTCNGNGGRSIGTNSVTPSNIWYWNERFRFWQHLVNAGMIKGAYTGVTDSTSVPFYVTPGVNTPLTKADGTTFTPAHTTNSDPGTAAIYVIGNLIEGPYLEYRSATGSTSNAPLTPMDAYTIDRKIDDGLPVKGTIIAPKSSYATYLGCTTTDTAASTYNLTNNSVVCLISYSLMSSPL